MPRNDDRRPGQRPTKGRSGPGGGKPRASRDGGRAPYRGDRQDRPSGPRRGGQGGRGGPGGFRDDRRPPRRDDDRPARPRDGEGGGERRPEREFAPRGKFGGGPGRPRRDFDRPARRDARDGQPRRDFDRPARGDSRDSRPPRRDDWGRGRDDRGPRPGRSEGGPRRDGGGGGRRFERSDRGDRGDRNFSRQDRRPSSLFRDDHRERPRRFDRRDEGPAPEAQERPQGWGPADRPSEHSWERVAEWYDDHLRNVDTHHSEVLAPGVEALLPKIAKGKLLDVGCGPGFFCRYFAERGWKCTGIDVSPSMIDIASTQGQDEVRYVVGDAETLHELGDDRDFDAVISIVALQNITHADRAMVAASRRLKPGGVLIGVVMHPAFRFPRQSSWGWDEEAGAMFRRIDRYLSKDAVHIVMHPGADPSKKTTTLHRPIGWYVNALADAGLLVDRMEEWCSHRESNSGRRRDAENKVRKEIPLFLAFRARRVAS